MLVGEGEVKTYIDSEQLPGKHLGMLFCLHPLRTLGVCLKKFEEVGLVFPKFCTQIFKISARVGWKEN